MKFEAKKDLKRIVVVCFAALVMALNIKTFVRAGGLYPGGATGLTLLVQRSAKLFFHIAIPYTLVNVLQFRFFVNVLFRSLSVKSLHCIPV